MGATLLVGGFVAQRFFDARGKSRHLHLVDAEPRPLEQSRVVLAQGKDEEPPVVGEQGQEREDVEAVPHHHEVGETARQPIVVEHPRGDEQREPVTLMLPERLVVQEVPGGLKQADRLGATHSRTDQTPLRQRQKVLEPHPALDGVGPHLASGEVHRHRALSRMPDQTVELLAGQVADEVRSVLRSDRVLMCFRLHDSTVDRGGQQRMGRRSRHQLDHPFLPRLPQVAL